MVLYYYYFKIFKSFFLEYLYLCVNESYLLRLDFDVINFFYNIFMNILLKFSV